MDSPAIHLLKRLGGSPKMYSQIPGETGTLQVRGSRPDISLMKYSWSSNFCLATRFGFCLCKNRFFNSENLSIWNCRKLSTRF
jgi:hypothetical protein